VRTFWVAPSVLEAGLIPGARISVVGHQEGLTARWIVTELTLDAPRARIAREPPW
jgi:hypothetical protein